MVLLLLFKILENMNTINIETICFVTPIGRIYVENDRTLLAIEGMLYLEDENFIILTDIIEALNYNNSLPTTNYH